MKNNFSKTSVYKQLGISYLAGLSQSAKMNKSFENGTLTLCLYLAPSIMSGYNVCPKSDMCKDLCLNGSGRNKMDIMGRGFENSSINISRIKKTKFFYENRELFMLTLIAEIQNGYQKACTLGMDFSVRLNGTSDLSPLTFKHPNVFNGMNILEIFPNIQFYDYTKVFNRIKIAQQYPNYDITFSFDGTNWNECEEYLKMGGKVAVVFDTETMPKSFHGYPLHDANEYDMRYLDPAKHIMYLHYHRTANNYKSGKYQKPNSPFVITDDNINLLF